MSNNRLISHYANLQHAFRHYLQRTRKYGGMEDIHQLRVNVKKMRAIWSLIQQSTEAQWQMTDHRSLTKPLFKRAGHVRDIQVSLSLIRRRKANYLLPFIAYLEAQQAAASAKLVDALPSFELARLDQLDEHLIQEMRQLSEDRVVQHANAFLQQERVKVKALTEQLPDLQKLHKIRIRLKAVGEVLRLLENLHSTTQQQELHRDVKQWNKTIGRWHDDVNLLAALHRFLEAHPQESNPYFRPFKARLRSKVLEQAEQLRGDLQNKFSN